jgi:protein transport protein SEC24
VDRGLYIWVGRDVPDGVISQVFNVKHYGAIPEFMLDLPHLDNLHSKLVNQLIYQIRSSRQHFMPLLVIREDGPHRLSFINRLVEDKTEDGTTYYEFISHVAKQFTK